MKRGPGDPGGISMNSVFSKRSPTKPEHWINSIEVKFVGILSKSCFVVLCPEYTCQISPVPTVPSFVVIVQHQSARRWSAWRPHTTLTRSATRFFGREDRRTSQSSWRIFGLWTILHYRSCHTSGKNQPTRSRVHPWNSNSTGSLHLRKLEA